MSTLKRLNTHSLESQRFEADCRELARKRSQASSPSRFLQNEPNLVGPGGVRSGFSHGQEHSRSSDVGGITKGAPSGQVILVVENNELLKVFMANLVGTAGFVALQASNADEALTILELRPDIALLVTNVVMHGSMDGAELAHAVCNRWPAVKIMVVSGKAGLSEQDLPAKSVFFSKPYHDEELVFEIRSLIGP
jgi:CheY-like chemotaxis protein